MPLSQIESASLATGVPARSNLPAGCILQVQQAVKTTGQLISSTTLTDVTGLSVTITPTSATSRFMVWGDIASGGSNGNYVIFQLVRNSTNIYLGTEAKTYVGTRIWYPNSDASADSGSMGTATMMFLDSPATASAITYKIQARVTGGTGAVNRRSSSDDTSVVSSLTVMEVAA
jgi:hypothetical protein